MKGQFFKANGSVRDETRVKQSLLYGSFSLSVLDCEQSLFWSKIRWENERDCMRDIRAASGESASRE